MYRRVNRFQGVLLRGGSWFSHACFYDGYRRSEATQFSRHVYIGGWQTRPRGSGVSETSNLEMSVFSTFWI